MVRVGFCGKFEHDAASLSRSLEQGTRRHGVHKNERLYSNSGEHRKHGMTFKDQQTLIERTGAFKDRVTRELRRHTWDQIKQSDMREKLGHRTGGAKTQNSPGA